MQASISLNLALRQITPVLLTKLTLFFLMLEVWLVQF